MSVSPRRAPRAVLVASAALALAATRLVAQTPVYPGDPAWFDDARAGGAGAITASAPRNGNASLELSTGGSLNDWAFWLTAVADPTTQSWGRLADVAALTFDWQRGAAESMEGADAPWLAQTPALRLHLREETESGPVFSELVWERWYSDAAPVTRGAWFTEDLVGGGHTQLWRVYGAAVPGTSVSPAADGRVYSARSCTSGGLDPADPLLLGSIFDWAGDALCLGSPDAVVWGLSIGVGSNWPMAYTGYVDDVVLDFATTDPTARAATYHAVSANFELPTASTVPEPATVALLGGGLLGLGAVARRRTRRAMR